jgi:hypothetical protein
MKGGGVRVNMRGSVIGAGMLGNRAEGLEISKNPSLFVMLNLVLN